MEVVERARRYCSKLDGAVSGSGGHNTTIHVACILVKGFDLGEADAMTLMREWNLKCSPAWSEKELQHKVKSAAALSDDRKRGWLLGEDTGSGIRDPGSRAEGPAVPVPAERAARFAFDEAALRRLQHPGIEVTRSWLLERSYSDVRHVNPGSFLRAVFRPGERILTFMSDRSQGEWGYCVGKGWLKLAGEFGPERAPKNERTPFPYGGRLVDSDDAGPRSGKLGVWYLSQPVDGMWHWSGENLKQPWTRRSWNSVTEWRHMVLESDDAPADIYLNWLVQQPLPIVAIYTSAGKSVHALLRFEGVKSKAHWDALKNFVMPYFSKVGVDWKTLTAVRLTRLPSCWRQGKLVRDTTGDGKKMKYVRYEKPRLQRLLYMNALAEAVPIIDLPLQREVLSESSNQEEKTYEDDQRKNSSRVRGSDSSRGRRSGSKSSGEARRSG